MKEPRAHARLGSPRRSPDPSYQRSQNATQFQTSTGSHITLPVGHPSSKHVRTWSPNVGASDLVVHIEEPNPVVNQQKRKVHQELKYLVDDLQRRQLTEARRALTSITTQKTSDLEKYAYPKGRGLVWVASQAVKPKIAHQSLSPAVVVQPQQIVAPSPVPSLDGTIRYQTQAAPPDQVIVTPGFATGTTLIPPTPPTLILPAAPMTQLPSYAPTAVGDLILPAGLGDRLFSSNAAALNVPTTTRFFIDPNNTATYLSTRDRLMLSPGQNYTTLGRHADAEFDAFRRNRMAETNGFVPGLYIPNQTQDPSQALNSALYNRGVLLTQQPTDQSLTRIQPTYENDPFGIRTNLTPQDPATIKRDSKLELIASLQQQLDDLYRVELYRSAVDANTVGQNQQPSPGNMGFTAATTGNASINELKKSIDQRWQQLDQSSTLLRNLSANRLAQTLATNNITSSSALPLNQQAVIDPMAPVMANNALASTLYDPFPVRDLNALPNVIVEEITNDTGSVISSPNQMGALVTSPTYSSAFNQLQSTIEPIIQQSAQTQQMQAQLFQQQQQIAQTQQQLQVLQQQTSQIQQQNQQAITGPVQIQDATGNIFNQVAPNSQLVMANPNAVFDPTGVGGVKNPPNLALTPLQQHQQQAFSLGKKEAPDFGPSYNSKTQSLPHTKPNMGAVQNVGGLIRPLEQLQQNQNQQQSQSLINSMNNNPYATLSRAAVNEYSNHPQFYDNQVLSGARSGQRIVGHFGGNADQNFPINDNFFNLGGQDKAIRSMTDLTRTNQPPDLLERALIKPSQLSIEDLNDGHFKRQVEGFRQDGTNTNNRGLLLQEFPTRDPGSINFSQLPLKSFRLSQDPKDRSGRSNGLGLSIVGGKIIPETSNTKVAMIQKIFPGKVAEILNPQLQEGDIVIEWNGNSLVGKTYEEVQHIIQSKTTGDVDILVCPQAQAKSIMSKADRTAQMSVYSANGPNQRVKKEHDFHNMQFIKGQFQLPQQTSLLMPAPNQWSNQGQIPGQGQMSSQGQVFSQAQIQGQFQGQLNPQMRNNLSASYNQDLNRNRIQSSQADDPIQYGNPGNKAWRGAGIYSTLPRGSNMGRMGGGVGGGKPPVKGLWLDQESEMFGAGQGNDGLANQFVSKIWICFWTSILNSFKMSSILLRKE